MKKIILVVILIILLITVYSALAIFSEKREYSNKSLEYFLLTPHELSQISKLCEDPPIFIYSSADGPKPAIINLHCTFEESDLTGYLKQKKYNQIKRNSFKKEEVEIEFEMNDNHKVIVTTLYEYL